VPTDKRLRQREGRQARQAELRRAQQRKQQRRRYAIIGVVVVVLFGVFYFATRGSSKKKTNVSANASSTTAAPGASTTQPASATTVQKAVAVLPAPANVGCPKPDGSSPHYTKFSSPPPMCIDPTKKYTATIQTDVGTITATLDATAAPKTANNFAFLAGYHFFDGIVFHRVVPAFVIQGGDPTGTGSGGPGYQFADELPKAGAYKIGSLAMANSGPNTNGSQFFIITGQQGAALPPNYSLFGQVVTGGDVMTKINADGAADPNPPKVTHRMVNVTVAEA
jgi:cyclophilin family peptidyl-prolyl cis-trans isomerase